MPRGGWRERMAGGLVLLALAGCGGASEDGAGTAGAQPATDGLTETAAAKVLKDFDQADSAASTAGDVEALGRLETEPALLASVAAVHRARFHRRVQPAFSHVEPAFARPAGDPRCFLATARLQLTGEELTRTDVSQFVRGADGQWRLSHNVQVAADLVPVAASLAGAPAGPVDDAVDGARRQALSAQVFARTTGSGTPDLAVLAHSAALDEQLAAGWSIYMQQMGSAGMAVDRRLTGSEWSSCAAHPADGTIVFLTLNLTDSIVATIDGKDAVLAPPAPDLVAVGRTTPVTGKTITVTRTEVFLLHVPAQPGAAAKVLGLTDTATKVQASG